MSKNKNVHSFLTIVPGFRQQGVLTQSLAALLF